MNKTRTDKRQCFHFVHTCQHNKESIGNPYGISRATKIQSITWYIYIYIYIYILTYPKICVYYEIACASHHNFNHNGAQPMTAPCHSWTAMLDTYASRFVCINLGNFRQAKKTLWTGFQNK